MIVRLAVAGTALAALAGCGDDSTHPKPASGPAPSPVAERVSDWSSAAVSYNTILQRCNQPTPTHGYVAVCTRKWRRNYERETARLRRALVGQRPSSRTCMQSLVRAKSLALETTTALQQAFEYYSAVLDNRPYRGPPIRRGTSVFGLLKRADRISKRHTKLADRLSNTIRQHCMA
jgi:hypothetical protein